MKRLFIGSVSLIALVAAGPVAAADMPVRAAPVYKAAPGPIIAAYNWTGFYVGLNAGYGWNDDDGDPFCIDPAGVLNGLGCTTNNVPGAQIRSDGFIGGGQAGYNWQSGQWVFGIEGDLQWANIEGDIRIPGPFAAVGGGASPPDVIFVASHNMDVFGTARGRIGAVWGNALIFVTGGLAYGRGEVSHNGFNATLGFPGNASYRKTGWTAGGGIEWAWTVPWSVKIEALYYDLGDLSVTGAAVPPVNDYLGGKNFELQGAIVRAGINYRWGAAGKGPVVSRY
jgi:outer membrane immunogenic protein